MALQPGSRLGPYEVLAELGRGGMGEVYRARDHKLNRDVALKVLPDLVADDPERLARFRREAQVLASLNHPNIAHIFGFEDSGPSHALVMELVEGPTLADLMAAGQMTPEAESASSRSRESTARQARGGGAPRGLSLDDVLSIGRQIADALEAAHEQGIVHRDLKPANVKVRDDGTVKVLDFGLAKAMDTNTAASAASASNSPTLTAAAFAQGTKLGVILGTAAYMAPEQARGRSVDRRADIWAFGVVLYEMLAQRRAFAGDDVSITLANVLKEDVQWNALPADLPVSVRRLLRRCLEKDPKRRLASITDARLELDDATSPMENAPSAAVATRSGVGAKERWIWAAVASLAVIAAIVFAWRSPFVPDAAAPPLARFPIFPPGDGGFSGSPPRFALSPDGRSLVLVANSQPGKPDQLWMRRLDSTEITPVPGTESGADGILPQAPFWSPDGRYVAFYFQTEQAGPTGQSRLRTVDLETGRVQAVCALPANNAGGSWNADGVMLVASQNTNGILRVPASGGTPTPVTTLDASRNEVAHLFPQFLPDGRHFIYQAHTIDRRDVTAFVGSLDSPERQKLVRSDYARFAAPNMLLYFKDDSLLAQIMDPETLALGGEPVVIATGLSSVPTNGRAGFAVSNAGVLVYSNNPDTESKSGTPDRQLTWVDRHGKTLRTVGAPTSASALRLSPDGTRVALLEYLASRFSGASGALWVADLERDVRAPLTVGRTLAISPAWSQDSTRLVFGSRADDGAMLSLAERVASGATPASQRYEVAGKHIVPLDQSADGTVVFTVGAAGVRSLHILPKGGGPATAYLSNEFDYAQASLSRDGKWLAYVSNESNVYEVIVQSFPDPSRGKWPISTGGGVHPRWRRDGSELFYMDTEQRLVAVPMTAGTPGRATTLFTLPSEGQRSVVGAAYVYDVAPDGQKFLLSMPLTVSKVRPLTVTTNWTTLLKK